MTRRILVPIDDSPQATAALEWVVEEFPDATVLALHVIDPVEGGYSVRTGLPVSSEEWYEEATSRAEELFEEARELIEGHGLDLETETEVGRPARTIVDRSEADEVDQIVMGSHGRSGVSRVLLGSVAETVVRRASVPVTVVR